METCRLEARGVNLLLLGNEGLEGEVEFGDLAGVMWPGSLEELMGEIEIAVWDAPVKRANSLRSVAAFISGASPRRVPCRSAQQHARQAD